MDKLKEASACSSPTRTSAIDTKDLEEEPREKAEHTVPGSDLENNDLPQDSSLLCDSEVDRWDRLLSTIKEIESEGGAGLTSPCSSDSSTPTYHFRSTRIVHNIVCHALPTLDLMMQAILLHCLLD